MPTAKEVDNRPVAVGKWPRHHLHHHHQHRPPGFDRYPRHPEFGASCGRQKCDESCVHKHANICIDVLLKPELLNQIYAERGIFSNSSNPLLEYCLDGGYLKDLDPENREILPPILELCSQLSGFEPPTSDEDDLLTSESFEERLEHLCQSGCDINVRSAQGYTALHFLINGCSKDSFGSVIRGVAMLLRHGFDVTLEDCDGNNSLNFISKLLERRLYNEALQLARILLQQRACDANRVNAAGRSLLSQSVTHGDACADLTRLLLNYGAQVLPFRASPSSDADDVARERDASAFTWFLRTAMRHQDLSASRVTLRLLCDALAVDAEFMRRHVLSTMLHLGQQSNGANSASLASLFVQIKSAMTPFWRQPLSLRHACVARIRASLGPKNMIEGGRQLNLPPSLLRHLHLE